MRFFLLFLFCATGGFSVENEENSPLLEQIVIQKFPYQPLFSILEEDRDDELPEVSMEEPLLDPRHGVLREDLFAEAGIVQDPSLDEVLTPWIGQEISEQMLDELKQVILDYYVAKGYPSIHIEFPDQDLSEGILTIELYH